MEIQYLGANELIILDRNPRKITRKGLEELKASLTRDPDFLLKRPVLVNEVEGKYMVYAGTQRLRGLKELGYKEIPCFVQKNLATDVMERRMVLDNLHSGKWEFKGDTVAEFAPIGSLVGDRFQINAEQVTGFHTDSILEPRGKTPTRNYFTLEFSNKADYETFVELANKLALEFPHMSAGARLTYYLRTTYGGSRN